MCGIGGIINLNGQTYDLSHIETMSKTIAHRGPDDEGVMVVDKNWNISSHFTDATAKVSIYKHQLLPLSTDINMRMSLFQRRLSIIDLSPAGHQPMPYLNKRYWITYNGEIYNYQSLKKELELLGHHFSSNSDTEVLLAAYSEWNEKMLNKLNGMWAFVIYDSETQKLFGARDRNGIKPLYYAKKDHVFAFCSEIKGLLSVQGLSDRKINKEEVWAYLAWGVLENCEQSIWTDIHELKPATFFKLDIQNGTFSIEKYYEQQHNNISERFSVENSKTHSKTLLKKLQNAVKLRLHSDVKVGVSLSGGLDSSAICAIAQKEYIKHKKESINAFTVSFPGDKADETSFAEKVATDSGVNWHKILPSNEISPELIEKIIYIQDLPFWGISLYSHYKLMEGVASQNIKVFLEGQGSDEILGGYLTNLVGYLRENIRAMKIGTVYNFLKNHQNNQMGLKTILVALFKNIITEKSLFFRKYLLNHHSEFETFCPQFKNEFINSKKYDLQNTYSLNDSLSFDSQNHYLKFLLRAADRNSMYFGIECRTPFADDIDLIEYVNNVPSCYKTHNGYTKNLLREAMDKLLPNEVTWRKDKKGFSSPDKKWILHILNDFDTYLDQDLTEYFDIDKLKALLQNYRNYPERYFDNRIWRIINFIIWKKVYDFK